MKPSPTDLVNLCLSGCNFYSYKPKIRFKALGILLIIMSLVIVDGGVGLFFGVTLLSGIPIRTKVRSIKNEIITRWRLR